MVNNHFGQSNDPYWYPQLPEGYQVNESNRQRGPIPTPGYGGTPGHQASPQHFQGGMTDISPAFGGPSFNRPPFGNQGFPGFPVFPGFPPGQGQHGGPSFPPGQQGGNMAPQNPPPNWTPEYPQMQTRAVDPGAISGCMYRFTYVWLSRRQGFWFFPVFVGPRSVAGYRWNSRRRRWEYTGVDLNQINSFTCI